MFQNDLDLNAVRASTALWFVAGVLVAVLVFGCI